MAVRSLSTYFPFLVVTLVCVAGVEMMYLGVERYLLEPITPPRPAQVLKSVLSEKPETIAPAAQEIDYSIITERNLFGPAASGDGVAENETEAIPAEELEATKLEIVLMGTIGADEDGARAIIMQKKDRTQALYREGDTIEGAVIKDIQRGRVILTVGGQDEMLDITEAREYAQGGSAPVAANPALRRRPVIVAPQETGGQLVQEPPKVVQPLRRIVRPRAAVQAEPAQPVAEEAEELPPEPVTEPQEGQPEEPAAEEQAEQAVTQ